MADITGLFEVFELGSKKGGCWALLLILGVVAGVMYFFEPSPGDKEAKARVVLISWGVLMLIVGAIFLVGWVKEKRRSA